MLAKRDATKKKKKGNNVSEQHNESKLVQNMNKKAFYSFVRICLHRQCSPKCSNLHVSFHTDEIFSRRAAHCFNCFSACAQLFTVMNCSTLLQKRQSLYLEMKGAEKEAEREGVRERERKWERERLAECCNDSNV